MYDKPATAHRSASATARRRVRLLGQPQLADYLDFVREQVVDGHLADVRALVDEWREANDLYYDLEQDEDGIADEIEIRPLDRALAPLAKELAREPRFAAAFAELPTEIALVELDRLIVSQLSVSLNFAETLMTELGPKPSPEKLFRFCLAPDRPEAPVRIQQLDDKRYLFTSDSSDFRAQEPVLLRADQILGLPSPDPVSAALGLAVGYGSNVLHAIRTDDRLILQNGHHRAYALRALGLTHAVCAIQTVTRRDELRLVASDHVADAPEFYCGAKRPPLLKDFFDERIAKVLNVRKTSRVIEVRIEAREHIVVE